MDASRSSAQDCVSTLHQLDSAASTDVYSVLYSISLAISTSKPVGKDQPRNCGALIDFRGFLDLRYAVLCIGGFFAQLGQWIPSYYISKPNMNRSQRHLLTVLRNVYKCCIQQTQHQRVLLAYYERL